jgi:hypothetical protein
LSFGRALNALILNGNRVSNLDGVAALSAPETLVVSQNEVDDLALVACLPRLRKLSASHNRVRALPPAFATCAALAVPRRPPLHGCPRDESWMWGRNRLTHTLDALAVLDNSLEHLSVAGNPIARNSEACREVVLRVCPKLQILDGARIAGGRRKVRMLRERRTERALHKELAAPDDHRVSYSVLVGGGAPWMPDDQRTGFSAKDSS